MAFHWTAATRGAPRHDQRSFVLSTTRTYLPIYVLQVQVPVQCTVSDTSAQVSASSDIFGAQIIIALCSIGNFFEILVGLLACEPSDSAPLGPVSILNVSEREAISPFEI